MIACDSALEQLQIGSPVDCTCDGDAGELQANLGCNFATCLAEDLFCGTGEFETTVDVETAGLTAGLSACLNLDAGLPVDAIDEVDVCFSASMLNGAMTGCSAAINGFDGIFGGGDCACSICPNGISVSIDCSMVSIGLSPLVIPGPTIDFCALADFRQYDA